MQEVALLLSVDVTTVRRWIGQGYLRARRFGPRLIRVDKATVCDLGDSVVWQGPLAS